MRRPLGVTGDTGRRSSGAVTCANARSAAATSIRSVLRPSFAAAVAFVKMGDGEGREPGFAAHGPAFVGRRELVGFVQRAEVHFDLVAVAVEQRAAAARAEMAAAIVAGLAVDGHRILGEDGG